VFGKNLYRWHLVPSQQDLLSADVLAQILLREKPRVGQQSLLADIKDTTTKPYVVAVRSDCDLESELYDYWITEFAGLPAHLFVLGAADRRPELGKREINEVRYLDASDEDLQTKWIDKIDIALEYSIGTG
jgi:hypothetical protein